MDKLHKRILQAIPVGSDRPRPRREIEQMLGLSKRSVEKAIERLIYRDGIPIVAIKQAGHNGYYLPRNEEERQEGLQAYKGQIRTSQRRVSKVESVDLMKFHQALKEGVYARTV